MTSPDNTIQFQLKQFIDEVGQCALEQQKQARFLHWLISFFDSSASDNLDQQVRLASQHAATIIKNMGSEQPQEFKGAMEDLRRVITKLGHSPFTRENRMPKEVQDYLNPKLAEARKQKAAGDTPENLTERRWQKGLLASQLNPKAIIKLQGSEESCMITDVNGKPVGLFKRKQPNLSLRRRIALVFERSFGQRAYLSPQIAPKSELAAYSVSKNLGFNLVVPNSEKTLYTKEGVFQIWISKEKSLRPAARVENAEKQVLRYEEAKKRIPELESKDSYTLSEQTIFQKFALFDYLIGNLDRHDENWMLILDNNQELKAIKAIDNTNAFPNKTLPPEFYAARKQYLWRKLKIAQQPFTQETKDFVKQNLTRDKIDQMLLNLEKAHPEFKDPTMQQLLLERWQNICKAVTDPKGSPYSLSLK